MQAQERKFNGLIAIAALAVALTCALFGLAFADSERAAAQDEEPTERPNIVLIESDDQALESMRFMPLTNAALGDRGVTFDQSFATWPLCCPSRATLMTGQYPHNHGVLGNKGAPFGGFSRLKLETALPVWLDNAGYYTAHIGKFLNGYEESEVGVPPGWNEWHGSKDTYRFYGYDLFEGGQWVEYGNPQEDPDAPAAPGSYSTDVYTQKAVDLIGERAPSDDPFFLSLAYLAPHGGAPHSKADNTPSVCANTAKPAVRHLNTFATEPLPLPPNFNEANVSDKPLAVRERGLMGPSAITRATRNYRCRAGSLLAIDEGVQRIVNKLRDSGELDNTLIIYTSDNGFFHGEHRIVSGKNRVYEEAVRVPLLMRGPGIPKGETVEELAGNIDLAPTIADAAEATPLVRVDGRTLLPLAEQPDRFRGREMLLEQFSGLSEAGEPTGGVYQAVRTHRYKYVENTTGEVELYDLALDPYELDNVAGTSGYEEIQDALAARLANLKECSGGECRLTPKVSLKIKAKRKKGNGRNCYEAKDFRAVIPRTKKQVPLNSAEFRVNGRLAGVREEAPFKLTLKPRLLRNKGTAEIAVTAELIDGRKLTLTDERKICR